MDIGEDTTDIAAGIVMMIGDHRGGTEGPTHALVARDDIDLNRVIDIETHPGKGTTLRIGIGIATESATETEIKGQVDGETVRRIAATTRVGGTAAKTIHAGIATQMVGNDMPANGLHLMIAPTGAEMATTKAEVPGKMIDTSSISTADTQVAMIAGSAMATVMGGQGGQKLLTILKPMRSEPASWQLCNPPPLNWTMIELNDWRPLKNRNERLVRPTIRLESAEENEVSRTTYIGKQGSWIWRVESAEADRDTRKMTAEVFACATCLFGRLREVMNYE